MAVANTHITSFPDATVVDYDGSGGTAKTDTLALTDSLSYIYTPIPTAEVLAGAVFNTTFPKVYGEYSYPVTVTSDLRLPSLGMEIGIDNLRADLVLSPLAVEADLALDIHLSSGISLPGLGLDASVSPEQAVAADLVLSPLAAQAWVTAGVGLSADLVLSGLSLSASTGEGVTLSSDMVLPALGISVRLEVSGDGDEILLTNKRGGDNWEPFA